MGFVVEGGPDSLVGGQFYCHRSYEENLKNAKSVSKRERGVGGSSSLSAPFEIQGPGLCPRTLSVGRGRGCDE